MPSTRRDFLKTVIKGSVLLSLPYQAFGRQHSAPIAANKLTDNVTLITGAGGNVVVLAGPEGLLMVNGGLPERSPDLMKLISDQFKGQRVQTLFNTDWHLDNTGSNETLRKAGAKIIAHENTKLWLGADFFCDWENRAYKPRPAQAFPNETFYTNGKINFGTEKIDYGYLPQAHTDGDIYLFFRTQNILVTGDIVSVGKYPIMDYTTGGWIGGMLEATKTLVNLANAETRVIPGSGPVQTRADLEAQQEMLVTMKERLIKLMRSGMGPDDIIAAAPTREFDARWGNPERFLKNAYPGMWGHVRELGGIV